MVGPSGSGKSSFLRLLNRLDEPTGGTGPLNGEDYRKLAPQELRRRVSMVMQTAYLFPGTVTENVAYGPRQRGQRLLAEQTDALLQRVGLSGYQERNASNLSGGEAQRVSIARPWPMLRRSSSWMSQPRRSMKTQHEESKILVLDIIRERRMTCVIVTHNNAQARRIAHRTMIIQGGKLVAIGPTDEVLRDD